MKKPRNLAFCEEELEKLRNTMNMYKNDMNKTISQKIIGENARIWEDFSRLLDQLSKILPLPSTDIKVIVKEIVTESLKASYYTAYLFILSIIAYPHTTNSRYPDSKKNWNPIEKYTESTPLIKMLPSFINEVEEALNYLSKLYSEIPSRYTALISKKHVN